MQRPRIELTLEGSDEDVPRARDHLHVQMTMETPPRHTASASTTRKREREREIPAYADPVCLGHTELPLGRHSYPGPRREKTLSAPPRHRWSLQVGSCASGWTRKNLQKEEALVAHVSQKKKASLTCRSVRRHVILARVKSSQRSACKVRRHQPLTQEKTIFQWACRAAAEKGNSRAIHALALLLEHGVFSVGHEAPTGSTKMECRRWPLVRGAPATASVVDLSFVCVRECTCGRKA